MIELKKKPFKLIDYVSLIASIFFISYYFLRLFGFYIDEISFIIPIIIAVCYMIITMRWGRKETAYIISILGFLFVFVLLELLCTNEMQFKTFVSTFSMLFMNMFPLYLVYSILKSGNKYLVIWILIYVFIVFAYVLIVTFIQLQKDDVFMRNMNIDYTNYREYITTDAGGYQFAYSMVMMVALLSSLIFHKFEKKDITKAGLIIALIMSIALVIASAYVLSLIIAIFSIIFAATLRIKETDKKVVFVLICVFALIIFFNFFGFIVNILPTDAARDRVGQIFDFFNSGDASGDHLDGRLSLYKKAIIAFFKSPLMGNETLSFDPHSSILRFFARDGFLGGVAFLLLYYIAYQIITKVFISKEKNKMFRPVFIALILMGFVNPIHSVGAVHYVAFFIAPLVLNLIKINQKENFNESLLGN